MLEAYVAGVNSRRASASEEPRSFVRRS